MIDYQVPIKTRRNTQSAGRNGLCLEKTVASEKEYDIIENSLFMCSSDQNFGLWGFVCVISKTNSEAYRPNMLYQLCCGLMGTLNWHQQDNNQPEVTFFSNSTFSNLKKL